MLNIIQVGIGGYGFQLLKMIMQLHSHYKIIGVAEPTGSGPDGRALCLSADIPVYDSLVSLLNHVGHQADVAIIPTPIHTHRPIALQCLAAGLHCFVEKPPVATIQELDELADASSRAQREVAVLFQHLHSGAIQRIKHAIMSSEFGRIRRIRALGAWIRLDDYFQSPWKGRIKVGEDWVLDGTLQNPFAHLLSGALYLASGQPGTMAEPAQVRAELYHAHAIEGEDLSCAHILLNNGIEVFFHATTAAEYRIEPQLEIETDQGQLHLDDFREASFIDKEGRRSCLWSAGEGYQVHHDMLMENHDALVQGVDLPVPLEACRPFTVAVNAAFESAGPPRPIPSGELLRRPEGNSVKTEIRGINHVLLEASRDCRLLSELGLKWASETSTFEVGEYRTFPRRFVWNQKAVSP